MWSNFSMSGSPDLLVERDGHILTLVMNRPEAKNAFSAEMLVRMVDAWEEIDADPEVRVAILTGADNTFCAGADLKTMFGGQNDDEWSQRFASDADMAWKALLRHYQLTKPLIAAVEGYAVAGGTEILQATDIRVAGEAAQFAVAEVKWGLFPLGGSTVRLRRQIPYTIAADILLTGRRITAREALDFGLIGYVVPDGSALEKAREIAAVVAANGPVAVQGVLRSLRETEGLAEDDALDLESMIGMEVFKSEDAKEGPVAFMEKRPANFQGK